MSIEVRRQTEKVFRPRFSRILIACGICFVIGCLFHRCLDSFDTRCVDGAVEVHLENGDGSSSWYDTEQRCKCQWWSKDDCVWETRLPVYPGKG